MIRRIKPEKKKINPILLSAALAAVMIVIFIFWFGEGGIKENLELKKTIQNLDWEIEQLKVQNDVLEEEIMKMKKDPAYLLEKIAREELRLKKENEKVIYFEEPADAENKKR